MKRLLAISLGLCLLTACASIETVKEARGEGSKSSTTIRLTKFIAQPYQPRVSKGLQFLNPMRARDEYFCHMA
jgi:hypothetical protein